MSDPVDLDRLEMAFRRRNDSEGDASAWDAASHSMIPALIAEVRMLRERDTGPTAEFAEVMFFGRPHGITYIRPDCYRLWTRSDETWSTQVGDRAEAVRFGRQHKIHLADMRVEPSEWNDHD